MPTTKSISNLLHKTNYDLFSDTVESYVNSKDNNNKHYLNSLREDINYSSNFLKYLIINSNSDINRRQNRTYLNSTQLVNNNYSKNDDDDNLINDLASNGTNLSAALIQLFIVILIFLIVFLVCKCNTILTYFRDIKLFPMSAYSSPESSGDESYRNRGSFRELLCYSCYRIKMKRRFKNRRLRNQRFNRNRAIRKHERVERSGSIYHRNKSSSLRTKVDSSNLKLSNYTLSGSIKIKRQKSYNSSTFSSPHNLSSRFQTQKPLRNSHV